MRINIRRIGVTGLKGGPEDSSGPFLWGGKKSIVGILNGIEKVSIWDPRRARLSVKKF